MNYLKNAYIGFCWAHLTTFLVVYLFWGIGHNQMGIVMLLTLLSIFLLIVGFCLLVYSKNRNQKLAGLLWAMFASTSMFWVWKIFDWFKHLLQ